MKLIYSDDDIILHHGDALETPASIQADAFMIDPPWARSGGVHTGRSSKQGKLSDDAGADQFWAYWFADVAACTAGATKPTGHGFIFCDEDTYPLVRRCFHAKSDWTVTQAIVWDREGMGLGSPYRAGFEMIAFARGPKFKWAGRRDLRNVIRYRWPYGRHEFHEAEKPEGLLAKLMTEYSDAPDGSLWLDNFTGSGSLLMAARRCGRRAVGIELNDERVEVAVKRLRGGDQTSLLDLLGAK